MAELIETIKINKGTTQEFYLDKSAAPSSPDRYYSHTIFAGTPGVEAFVVPRHWHHLHGEYATVLTGSLEFHLDGKTTIVRAGDPTVTIPRRVVHGFKFPANQRTVLEEKTDPTGGFKQRFLEDVFRAETMAQRIRAFADGDTYLPVPIVNSRWVWWVVGVVLGMLMPRVKPASRGGGARR